MKAFRMSSLVAAAVAAAAMSFVTAASASTLIFDRGLPGKNWNDTNGAANRSNIGWGPYSVQDPQGPVNVYFAGDDFRIAGAGQYVVDKVIVWGVQAIPLSTHISNISLFMGKSWDGDSGGILTLQPQKAGPADPVFPSTGIVTGNSNSNPNISHTYVSYPNNGPDSCGTGNTCNIVETVFSGLSYVVNAGELHDFGVYGEGFGWYSHATNALLGATVTTPQEGADNWFLDLFLVDASTAWHVGDANSADFWDRPTDINVRIYGTRVDIPEPSSLALLGIALAGLALSRRGK